MSKKKSKKNDIAFDLDGDDVAIDFGPIKIRGSKGPTAEEYKLREQVRLLQLQNEKLKSKYYIIRENAIKLKERYNFYRQLVEFLPKLNQQLDVIKKEPDNDKKKEAIEQIQKWIKDLTKDDNLEG